MHQLWSFKILLLSEKKLLQLFQKIFMAPKQYAYRSYMIQKHTIYTVLLLTTLATTLLASNNTELQEQTLRHQGQETAQERTPLGRTMSDIETIRSHDSSREEMDDSYHSAEEEGSSRSTHRPLYRQPAFYSSCYVENKTPLHLHAHTVNPNENANDTQIYRTTNERIPLKQKKDEDRQEPSLNVRQTLAFVAEQELMNDSKKAAQQQ